MCVLLIETPLREMRRFVYVGSLYNFDSHCLSCRGVCHTTASDLFPFLLTLDVKAGMLEESGYSLDTSDECRYFREFVRWRCLCYRDTRGKSKLGKSMYPGI